MRIRTGVHSLFDPGSGMEKFGLFELSWIRNTAHIFYCLDSEKRKTVERKNCSEFENFGIDEKRQNRGLPRIGSQIKADPDLKHCFV
jgi:hypothetical protein